MDKTKLAKAKVYKQNVAGGSAADMGLTDEEWDGLDMEDGGTEKKDGTVEGELNMSPGIEVEVKPAGDEKKEEGKAEGKDVGSEASTTPLAPEALTALKDLCKSGKISITDPALKLQVEA